MCLATSDVTLGVSWTDKTARTVFGNIGKMFQIQLRKEAKRRVPVKRGRLKHGESVEQVLLAKREERRFSRLNNHFFRAHPLSRTRARTPRASTHTPPMLAFVYTAVFVVAGWLPFVWHHYDKHGVINPTHVALTLFNAINVLICFWEHSLWMHRKKIKKEHLKLKRKFGDRRLPRPLCLFESISIKQAFSYEYWTVIWSQYSLLDPSYADQKSFGFWIDAGNGIVTIVPTVLLSVAATFESVDLTGTNFQLPAPKTVALIGMIINYQMLYGTALYFGNYCLNKYYVGANGNSITIVIIANCIWIFFPLWWMVVCWRVIESNEWGVLR